MGVMHEFFGHFALDRPTPMDLRDAGKQRSLLLNDVVERGFVQRFFRIA